MRSNTADAARRAYVGFSRGVLVKANDDPKMQEGNVRVLANEEHTDIERFQNYGFSSVPLGGSDGKYPEVVIAYLGGNRSHPVILAADDRRHRPKSLKPGESIQYDDLGQKVHLTRDGIVVDAGAAKKPIRVLNDTVEVKVESDKVTVTVKALKVIIKKDRIDLGRENAPFPIVTTAGPSGVIFGIIEPP
ncbi:MAG: phage baseplate assembly protein [Pseudolabrys sp.]